MENKEFGYDIENCCSSEIRNDGFTNVSTIDDCLKIIAQMCVQITDLKHENKLLSKALELMKDSKNYYLFVNENNETINVDFVLQQAEREIER